MVKTVSKKFDFYVLKYERQNKIDQDYSRLVKFLEETLEKHKKKEKHEFVKCNKNLYIGFNNIEKFEYENNEVWVFCLSKTDTSKLAVVNDTDDNVLDGRSEYGDKPTQGLTQETVVLFCPSTGIVIIPSNKGGVSGNNLIQFLYKNVKKQGAKLFIAINNTNINNIKHIDLIKDIEMRISRIVDTSKLNNANVSTKKTRKTIEKLNADTMYLTYKSNEMNIDEAVKFIKNTFKPKDTKVEKMIVTGENNGDKQIIDLVKNHLNYIDNNVQLSNSGKLLVQSMIDSIKKSYKESFEIIKLDIKE